MLTIESYDQEINRIDAAVKRMEEAEIKLGTDLKTVTELHEFL